MGSGRRPRTWWLVRFQLAVGIGLTLLVGRLGVESAMTMCGFCNPPARPVLPVSVNAAMAIAALAIAVAGLVWMVRIIRGPADEPPLWRYRDR